MRFYFLPPELPVLLMVPIKCGFFFNGMRSWELVKDGWLSDAGISRLGHLKMADPGKQLQGRISPCMSNTLSQYLDHMFCI